MRAARLLAVLVLMAAPVRTSAQNLPTALPFLEIPPSPALNAMGSAGVARTDADPYGFLLNPARLGITARDVKASVALYPSGGSDWLDVGDLSLGSSALSAGFDLQPLGAPLTLGIGLAETTLRYGPRTAISSDGMVEAPYEPIDRYRALSLGLATKGPVRLGLGTTVRRVTSTDYAEILHGDLDISTVRGFSFDLGLLADADVMVVLGQPRVGPVRPALSVSAGYAQTHMSGTVRYSGFSPTMPLPRTAHLGWAATGGFDLPTPDGLFRLVEAEVSVQAEHSLVRQDGDGRPTYASFLGDLSVQDAVRGQGSEAVTGRSGVRLTLAETVSLSRGGFDGWGYTDVTTRGFEVRLAGPLRALAWATKSQRVAEWACRFDVRYARTVYFEGGRNESVFNGLMVVVRQ